MKLMNKISHLCVLCLLILPTSLHSADLIIGANNLSGANKLFSFTTNGTSGNGVLDADYLSLGGGAQGVTYDPVTNRIFATRGGSTIAAFDYPSKTPVSGSPFTIPSGLTTPSLRNLRMSADNSRLFSAQFNSTPTAFGRVQSLSPTTPSAAPTITYSSVPNVHSMFQPSIGGFVYLMDNNGNITRFNEDGSNAQSISLTNKVTANTAYRDILFINPTTFFLSVRSGSGGTGGVYKFGMSNASDTTAALDTDWGSNGKALISNATGLAASTDGEWLYVAANFTPDNLSSMHSIRLTDGATNTLMSNIPGVYTYITVVPEPSSLILAGLAGLALVFRRVAKLSNK